MRVHLDLDLCLGYGNCVIEAPDHFELDDDSGKAIILIENPEESDRAVVEAAVRSCPAIALRLEG
ncbi:ferredoxin [Aeromicrobium piscarium]|mgnify:CR=1 FL=1|uniref:Ferredoxin n=1 Tax=Aeromicrobium piscarium TaxID=2590901 RepID=A0A554RXD8_9ACTN|nr:ferredoxin [Aeromicrobium piscarium]TSD58750.1 ferredoxin [Aeromicrobium piscarium]